VPAISAESVSWADSVEVRTVPFPKDTDKKKFLEMVAKHKMNKVIVLPEHKEHYEAGSSELLTFYKEECGMEVIHTPIVDFTTPTVEHEQGKPTLKIVGAVGDEMLWPLVEELLFLHHTTPHRTT
jgi:hypothetical protein